MNTGIDYIGWDKNHPLKRPESLPEILCCVPLDDARGREMIRRVYVETKLLPVSGYIFGCLPAFVPRRIMAPETKVGMRRKRLRKQVEERYPLFADEMERRTLEENPEKFSVEAVSAEIDEMRRMEKDDSGRFEKAMTPAEAMQFLRKVAVVPFCSSWVDGMNRMRQAFLKRQEAARKKPPMVRKPTGTNARACGRSLCTEVDNGQLELV